MRDFVTLTINGQRHDLAGEKPFMMLANFLREKHGLRGTKIVCAEGDCGACTVLCLRPHAKKEPLFEPINACIALVAQLDGAHILTIEALKHKGELSAVQSALVKCHASQCGYCTPGFAMAISALFEKKRDALSEQKVKNHLTGNLCRCTGYQSIIDAALAVDPKDACSLKARYYAEDLKKEPLKAVAIVSDSCAFYAPSTLQEACLLRARRPRMRIIGASTDLGVQHNKGKLELSDCMSLNLIEELREIKEDNGRIVVGALVTLSELRSFCQKLAPELARFLNIFASPQIKNMATLVGNVANGSPIGDTIPFLMVSQGRVHAQSTKGSREIPLSEFYKGYKELALSPSEIITHISFALPSPEIFCRLYKISQRKDLDISSINAAFSFMLDSKSLSPRISSAQIALGGVAQSVIRLPALEAFLTGAVINDQTVHQAGVLIASAIKPLDDLRGSSAYRHVLAQGLFRRFIKELLRSSHAAR